MNNMAITRGLENKVRRSVERAADQQDVTFNWHGESYRVSLISEQSDDAKVYRQDDEENRDVYVGTVKLRAEG